MTNRDLFWLSEAQSTRIGPHLPADSRGKPRVDDRRGMGGVVRDDAKAADETVFHP